MPIWLVIFLIVIILVVVLYFTVSHRKVIIGGAARLKNLVKNPRTRSEKDVIDIFEKITGRKFPTAYPKWLRWKNRPMELDGYNEELKIAVEFSGPLHTKFYPARETYDAYRERVEKDREKIRLCSINGVKLIVIDMSIPKRHLYNYINSRLYDAGVVKERPFNYMPEVIAEPYENPIFESERKK